VHFDETSQRWQMFAAEMQFGCGIGAWEANSRVVRASSASADGEYRFEAEIKGTFSHEPTVVRSPEGTWLLYHIGDPAQAWFPGSQPPRVDCEGGYTPRQRGNDTGQFHPPMEVLFAQNLTGPWMQASWHAGEGDINPAPWVLPDGSVMLLWRIYPHILLSTAPSWRTAFSPAPSYNNTAAIAHQLFASWQAHGIEDPFLWHCTACAVPAFHAIFHDHATFGGHGFSRDGIHWTYSPTPPYSSLIPFDDGSAIRMQRRERPHLILDGGGQPTHLVTAVQPPPDDPTSPPPGFRNDRTYTQIQPVRRVDG